MTSLELQDRADEATYVGESIPRVDAPAKVTGQAVYTMDIAPGDLLHAKLVTSPYAHAEIVSIDTSEAEALDGVHAVATHRDAPDTRRGAFIYDQPILAERKVRHIGEPVAIVAAETEEIAERAVSLVDVTYDRLDAIFDLEVAFERDPPAVVHENVRDYEFATQGDPRYGERGHVDDHDADRPNLLYKDHTDVGDVDAAFEEADHVVEATYEVKPISHCAMEPRVAIARVDGNSLLIETSHQVPHNIEKKLAKLFSFERSRVRVKSPYVGGGFGGKITAYFEAILVTVARLVSRPVRLQFTRAEEFMSGVSRPQVITRIKDGVTADGDLLAREAEMKFNCGAYNEQVFRCTVSATDQVYGAYDIPNVRWDSYAVYTNKPMFAAFRGFGKPEVNWAIERHMNRVAAELNLDPVEYRKRNLLREGDANAKGEVLGPNDTDACLDAPVTALADVDPGVDYPEYDPDKWIFGVGVGYANKSIARAAGSVTIKVQSGMRVEVHVGASDIGQGSDTAFTQIAAEAFGVDEARVTLVTGDTARTPYSRGPTGSRFTYHTGHAIREAVAQAKRRLAELAADAMDAEPDVLIVDGTEIVNQESGRSLHVNELYSDYDQEDGVSNTVLAAGGELIVSATYDARDGLGRHACWTPIGQAALVAVNRVTGQVDVLWIVTGCDVGCAINPKMVEQQLEGATGQGVASAVYEEVTYDGGRVTNPNFKDYTIPGPTELPYENETVIFESYEKTGPYGAKGVGEAGMLPAAPTVGNAVCDALGLGSDDLLSVLPLTPERVLDVITDSEQDW